MTAQTLPDDPSFCFLSAYDVEDEVKQIRLVIEGRASHVPTALIALTLADARPSATSSTVASGSTETPSPPRRSRPCTPRTTTRRVALGTSGLIWRDA